MGVNELVKARRYRFLCLLNFFLRECGFSDIAEKFMGEFFAAGEEAMPWLSF